MGTLCVAGEQEGTEKGIHIAQISARQRRLSGIYADRIAVCPSLTKDVGLSVLGSEMWDGEGCLNGHCAVSGQCFETLAAVPFTQSINIAEQRCS